MSKYMGVIYIYKNGKIKGSKIREVSALDRESARKKLKKLCGKSTIRISKVIRISRK